MGSSRRFNHVAEWRLMKSHLEIRKTPLQKHIFRDWVNSSKKLATFRKPLFKFMVLISKSPSLARAATPTHQVQSWRLKRHPSARQKSRTDFTEAASSIFVPLVNSVMPHAILGEDQPLTKHFTVVPCATQIMGVPTRSHYFFISKKKNKMVSKYSGQMYVSNQLLRASAFGEITLLVTEASVCSLFSF